MTSKFCTNQQAPVDLQPKQAAGRQSPASESSPTCHGLRRWARPAKVRRRGAAALEFAIVLPVFVTIVLGCVDFGRFAHSYIAVTNAARVGAGFGAMQRVTAGTATIWQLAIRQAAAEELAEVMLSDGAVDADLQVTATQIIEPSGLWRVQVTVVYPFESAVSWPFLPNRVDLGRTVVMRGIR